MRGRCCRFKSWNRCYRLVCFIPEYEFTVRAVWMISSYSPTASRYFWIYPKKTGCLVGSLIVCCTCLSIISEWNICPKADLKDFLEYELADSASLWSLFPCRECWALQVESREVFLERRCEMWCGRGVVRLWVSWQASVRWFCEWCWFWDRFILRRGWV